jgi:hypothetical protein
VEASPAAPAVRPVVSSRHTLARVAVPCAAVLPSRGATLTYEVERPALRVAVSSRVAARSVAVPPRGVASGCDVPPGGVAPGCDVPPRGVVPGGFVLALQHTARLGARVLDRVVVADSRAVSPALVDVADAPVPVTFACTRRTVVGCVVGRACALREAAEASVFLSVSTSARAVCRRSEIASLAS